MPDEPVNEQVEQVDEPERLPKITASEIAEYAFCPMSWYAALEECSLSRTRLRQDRGTTSLWVRRSEKQPNSKSDPKLSSG